MRMRPMWVSRGGGVCTPFDWGALVSAPNLWKEVTHNH